MVSSRSKSKLCKTVFVCRATASHPYQNIVVNGTAVHNGVVANGNIVANGRGRRFIGGVDYRPILHVHFIAHFYEMHITADYGVEPNTAFVAHYHIANDGSIFGNKTVFGNLRMFSVYGFDYHSFRLQV